MPHRHPVTSRPLSFWGWGYADETLSADERALLDAAVSARAPDGITITPPPKVEEYPLPAPRLAPPDTLAGFFTSAPEDRLRHAYGRSFADLARLLMRRCPAPPDLVARPQSGQDVADILHWADETNAAVIPFGGGSSVCGGVEPAVGGSYAGTVSLDLTGLGRVLEVDRASRAAHIQAGIYGPALEDALRPHGLTLRHFPQSFEFSTLGGWIATRSGGHYATLYTHIDDFVESIRMLTPRGAIETRRLPGSGAGPSPDRMLIGSEGVLGVITEAWMRLQDRPRFRGSASVTFRTMTEAADAVRALAQSGLHPANCRLLDPAEASTNGVGDGATAVLILGFESADHPLDAWLGRALELAGDYGGAFDREAALASLRPRSDAGGAHRRGAAGRWRSAFLRMPYYRDYLAARGMIVDTFESAITWDRFEEFYETVRTRMGAAIEEATGNTAQVSCRFTHVYPDGPAPYFSFAVLGPGGGKADGLLPAWRAIKQAANEVVVSAGGAVTHHHAVGRDHRPGYERQSPPLFREALQAAKFRFDPNGILNPGVLIDPLDRPVGATGALA